MMRKLLLRNTVTVSSLTTSVQLTNVNCDDISGHDWSNIIGLHITIGC